MTQPLTPIEQAKKADTRTDAQKHRDYINSLRVPKKSGPGFWRTVLFMISTGGHKP